MSAVIFQHPLSAGAWQGVAEAGTWGKGTGLFGGSVNPFRADWISLTLDGTDDQGIKGGTHVTDEMTDDEKRHDQLTTAPKAVEADAAPRITQTKKPDGTTRIDIADTAAVRPGKR